MANKDSIIRVDIEVNLKKKDGNEIIMVEGLSFRPYMIFGSGISFSEVMSLKEFARDVYLAGYNDALMIK